MQIQALAKDNAKFAAVDRAIGKQSLKVVTLLRLSPLLPLALSNYLYGLTSVDLSSYVLGSWLGMLPGTIAYVTVSFRCPAEHWLPHPPPPPLSRLPPQAGQRLIPYSSWWTPVPSRDLCGEMLSRAHHRHF